MSAGLPVKQNNAIAACPRLSASGRPIGALSKAGSMSCRPVEDHPRGEGVRYLGTVQRVARVNDPYVGPDRGIYLRPRAMRVDTYC
jgi:hypothetical protein